MATLSVELELDHEIELGQQECCRIENEIMIIKEKIETASKESKIDLKSQIKSLDNKNKIANNKLKQLKVKQRKFENNHIQVEKDKSLFENSVDGYDIPDHPTISWNKLQSLGHVSNVASVSDVLSNHIYTTTTTTAAAENDSDEKESYRVVCISDTHGKHRDIPSLPSGDILIHAGDITETGELEQYEDFALWFSQLEQFKYKICIGGNHDITLHKEFYQEEGIFEYFHKWRKEPIDCDLVSSIIKNNPNFIYLEDEYIEINNIKIYGSPYQPEYGKWAFQLNRGKEIASKWHQIPQNINILITHGPPIGHGDYTNKNERSGCVDLYHEIITRIKPKFHIFGHTHEGYGITTNKKETDMLPSSSEDKIEKNHEMFFLNASTCDRSYQPINPPLVFDIVP
mmetsp:Transcript_50868/g.65136  ORF Transcript_50868/g.65136 Transcript_50868/m.65136 type:complete len:400 (+) Transcript_50868:103-1302(+)